jgi:malic enzyme-like protein
LLEDHLTEMLPVVYDPVVAQAIERYSHEFQRANGVYLSVDDIGGVETAFRNYGLGSDGVDLLVASSLRLSMPAAQVPRCCPRSRTSAPCRQRSRSPSPSRPRNWRRADGPARSRAGRPGLDVASHLSKRGGEVMVTATENKLHWSRLGTGAKGTPVGSDSMGQVQVPAEHYWSAQAQRSLIHFSINATDQ